MKRLLTLTLALLTTLTLAACNTPVAETVDVTDTPQSAEITVAATTTTTTTAALTTTTAVTTAEITEVVTTTEPAVMLTMDDATEVHTADLSDGYRLEVGELGEKSGIIRLTDPNLQESYPATDPSFGEDRIIHRWEVSLTDTYSLAIYHSNKNDGDKSTISIDEMNATVIKIEGNRGMWIEPIRVQTDGKTITMQFEIPDEENFKWSDVTEYHVTIEDDPLDTLIAKDIFVSNMQSNQTIANTTTTKTTTINVTTTAATMNEMGVAEAVTEKTAAPVTTTAATTTAAKKEPAVCGTYRTVIPIDNVDPAEISPEEEMFYYSYINVDQMDDGHFQVEFRDPYGGSDESYAVFDTEALGTSQIINFSFDGGPIANSSSGSAVTITVDGDTAWVTFGDGEAEEYRKIE